MFPPDFRAQASFSSNFNEVFKKSEWHVNNQVSRGEVLAQTYLTIPSHCFPEIFWFLFDMDVLRVQDTYSDHGMTWFWESTNNNVTANFQNCLERNQRASFGGESIEGRKIHVLVLVFTSWWFQPIWKILVNLDHFPK